MSGKKIFWVVLLNAAITVAEFIGGLLSGSLALMSDAAHNLSDTVAIALSYFANRIAQKPKDPRMTFGYKRAEILAAFINSSVLLAISVMLIYEAIKRFSTPEPIDSTLMITVAFIGLLANLLSVFILEKDSRNNLNIKSSYLHLISDTVSSVGVITGGIAIRIWGIVWIDPLVTVFISFFIINKAWVVIRKTVDILMQSSAELDYEAIKAGVENIAGVKNIHHVHSWMSNEKTIYFEAHIDMEDMQLCEAEKIYDEIEQYLIENHGISHVTLQAEVDKCCEKSIFKC
ncbi:MAG: cation diffusion facilitator family transporter [Bacillota bacterium]|nr:cation diffusion facilitator family transporter [Bacillota bacterium]